MTSKSTAGRSLPPEIDRLDFVSSDDQLYLADLARELLADQVVLFAGAGLSKNAACCDGGESRIPDWMQLAERFRMRLGARLENEQDVLKIADYYEAKYGRARLVDDVILALRDEDHVPGRVHKKLVELNFPEILTTNFDTLIERTFRNLHIAPQVVVSDSDLAQRRKHPRILKINGCLTHGSKIVLTGNDFLAYSRNHPLIEVFIVKCFVESTVLFVGFSLDDPAFRILNEKVVSTLGENCRQAYSLSFGVSEEQRSHWSSRHVQLIDLAPCGGSGELDYEGRLYEVLKSLSEIRQRVRGARASRSPSKSRSRHYSTSHHERADRSARQLWDMVGDLRHRRRRTRHEASQSFFRKMAETWTLDGLAANDIDRCRFLTLASLFAPLSILVQLIDVWLGPDGEESLIHDGLRPFQPTPEEYRIPILGFCGLLELSPDLYVQAADSLWARQMEVDPQDAESTAAGTSDDPLEIAFRFRYLMQAGRLKHWATSDLQLQRLEMVLRRLFLENARSSVDCTGVLKDVLTDLRRGWVFGSPHPPESFTGLWAAARRDVAEGHSDAVPWEILSIVTLAIDGRSLTERFSTLTGAWHRGEFDLSFLVDYVARRLEGVGVERLTPVWLEAGGKERSNHASPQIHIPQLRYEAHLADLTRWLCERASGEVEGSADRLRAVERLPDAICRWASARKDLRPLRRSILGAFAAVVNLDLKRLGPDVRRWVARELPSGMEGLNELPRWLPEFGFELVDENRVVELLRAIPKGRPRLPVGTREWLLRWFGEERRKKPTAGLLGKILASELLEESQTGSLGWLSLAADLQRQPALRQSVEGVLAKGGRRTSESLFLFVKANLLPILEDLRRRLRNQAAQLRDDGEDVGAVEDYDAKVAAFHQNFAPFAQVVDEEFLGAVLTAVNVEDRYTRDGTVSFLAALLRSAPEELREEHGERWKGDLERLIAAGATGGGTLGPLLSELSREALETLQNNLAVRAAQRAVRQDAKPVQQILDTLIAAPAEPLGALEEALIELVASDSLEVAEASLASILGPIREHSPDFLNRHQRRLRRVRAVVRGRGSHRPTSRFAARLEALDAVLES